MHLDLQFTEPSITAHGGKGLSAAGFEPASDGHWFNVLLAQRTLAGLSSPSFIPVCV